MTAPRTPSAVDAVAEKFLNRHAALDPMVATYIGVPGHDGELPDLTPDWLESLSQLRRDTLAELAAAEPADAIDKVTVAALREELTLREELRAAGTEESDLSNIASPLQAVRDIFDLTPTSTADEWADVARRLAAVPRAIGGYVESLRLAASRGDVRARRQVEAGIKQAGDNTGPDGFFATFARGAAVDGAELPATLRAELERSGAAAGEAYAGLAAFLRDELLPQAPERDAVGREAYALHSRSFLGARIDLEETYAWGQQELARIGAEMRATAERIKPGASVAEAMDHLDADPGRKLAGTDALQAWMQGKSDAAVAALAGAHFDIPEPIRTLECKIAPTPSGGIYYTPPSDDLTTRPGRMWWAVPEGVTEFSTWRELTTVYHEGVPGHHLQCAQTIYRRELLNSWRRLGSWVSGHGEGWALYAERLMADLGFLDDPADYLGMLDSQSLRAARVVLDIGFHCGFEAPAELGGGEWTYDKAWTFLNNHVSVAEGFLRYELDRYLGWPGQAPSYKIGERLWLQLRDDARAKAGDAYDLKAFHREALDIGSVGLDVLRAAVLNEL
ncbi:DUF885 domain-containing protein [Jatrophihabitans cynanchi]|uniref:DUF885 domain-containing protein n=1 Tax=Jatrophihabitans cynanchi TaxID=2944128 RepID=A0ABY7K1N3_9ACTN|nr:DUF885 domain-containing protein [Jatrophihabitans sp. SB3-54]WAX58751.1 DUF885 domain-containing protein [Jatrophihabitans sp. SB3-54]